MEKRNILVTIAFDNDEDLAANVEAEYRIHAEIADLLFKHKEAGKISGFVIADDEVISEKLKS